MNKLKIRNNCIEIKNYCKINLGNGKSNIYNIFGLTSEGKSKLMQDIIDLNYSNVKVYTENEIEPSMLEKFKNNIECDVIFLDDISMPKNQSKEIIKALSELNQIIIIIDRIINRYSVNCLEVKQEDDMIIIDEIINYNDFSCNYLKNKINLTEDMKVLLLCEDSTSGRRYFYETFKNFEVKSFNGLLNLELTLKNINNDYYDLILLALDYVQDNPNILKLLKKLKLSHTVKILSVNTVEEIISIGFKRKYIELSDKILAESINRNNSLNYVEFLNYYKVSNTESISSFERLVHEILVKSIQYSKSDKEFGKRKRQLKDCINLDKFNYKNIEEFIQDINRDNILYKNIISRLDYNNSEDKTSYFS